MHSDESAQKNSPEFNSLVLILSFCPQAGRALPCLQQAGFSNPCLSRSGGNEKEAKILSKRTLCRAF